MAKLVVPTEAVRGPDSQGKWHLLKDDGKTTICKRWFDEWTLASVSKLKASDLCQRCLGAIKAED